MAPHRLAFTVALSGISQALILRDMMRAWIAPGRCWRDPELLASAHSIPSGGNLLDAVFVAPARVPAKAAVLLCHGIAETADDWFPVQRLLAVNGLASLLFDFSGYGKSTGRVDWMQFEQDAVSAFQYLQPLAPVLPRSLLGFSLGSGIAAAIVNRVAARRLVLCAAFTSFRDAARSVGVPDCLSFLVPPIWSAQESLRGCTVPVLIAHGEKDHLFPVRMARELAACSGPGAELIVAPGVTHIQPFRYPHLSFWGPIVEWLCDPPER